MRIPGFYGSMRIPALCGLRWQCAARPVKGSVTSAQIEAASCTKKKMFKGTLKKASTKALRVKPPSAPLRLARGLPLNG